MVLALALVSPNLYAIEKNTRDISFELQAYPTGVIAGIRFEFALDDQQSVHLRLGAQEIRHEDYGRHDDEWGDGYGFTLGYKRYWTPGLTGAALSFKSDLWFNTLDWRNNNADPQNPPGRTNVTVLQPTLEISWHEPFADRFFITPSLAAGFEINIHTDGEEVGEGFIYLAGIMLGTRF